jgi:hypothetical protein
LRASPTNYYDLFNMVPSALRERLRQGRVPVRNWHVLNWESAEQLARKRGVDKRGAKSDAAEVKGQDSPQNQAKRAALDEWTRAVTAQGGFGRWRWAVSRRPSGVPQASPVSR